MCIKKGPLSRTWWCIPVFLALGRLRREDLQFEANLGFCVCYGKSDSLGSSNFSPPTHILFSLSMRFMCALELLNSFGGTVMVGILKMDSGTLSYGLQFP